MAPKHKPFPLKLSGELRTAPEKAKQSRKAKTPQTDMAFVPTVKTKPRVLPPEDTHIVRCCWMIDLGTQRWEWKGEQNEGSKVFIGFELPYEKHTFHEDRGPEPFMVSKEFIIAYGKNANYRKFLESWRGKPFAKGELEEFDLEKLVGAVASLSVAHNEEKTYANILSIQKAGKRDVEECPKLINRRICLVLHPDHFDVGAWLDTPKFLQEKILLSPEGQELKRRGFMDDTDKAYKRQPSRVEQDIAGTVAKAKGDNLGWGSEEEDDLDITRPLSREEINAQLALAREEEEDDNIPF